MRPPKRFVAAPQGDRVPTRRGASKGRYATASPQVPTAGPDEHGIDDKVDSEAAVTIAEQAPRPDKFEARSLGGHLSPEAAEALERDRHEIDLRGPRWVSESWFEDGHYYRQDVRST